VQKSNPKIAGVLSGITILAGGVYVGLWAVLKRITNHKRLNNLVETASFVDKSWTQLEEIKDGDNHRPPPYRDDWFKTVRNVDYQEQLREVTAPTLLCVGRYDPQTSVTCSEELARGSPNSKLVIFENSGHSPFIEEPDRFVEEVTALMKVR
jgi:proline iminopeptidase